MSLLIENWVDIPNRFTDDILNGAATYLAHRFGNLNFDANQWQYIEEPNPQALASLILDEIERHPVRWHHCHATANALEACANVVEDELNASRLLFASIGFLNYRERESDSYSANLIDVGINMSRGKVAEAVIIIATRWAEKRWQFPELLVPTLRRFACDPNPAVRASILRRLHYFQSHAPELGWEIFHLAMEESDERLWEIAEPCLYYNYHNQFEQVSIILDRIVSSATEKELESWGRISALAAFLGYVDINDFVDRLTLLANADAWKGAASVWTHHENVMQYRNQCFLGLMTGLQQSDEVTSSIATEMASLFQKSEPITSISREIVNLYFSAIEQKKDDGRFNLYGLDDWLNATSLNRPDDALAAAERFADFVLRTKHHLHDFGAFSQLLTRLFREAEEREESDGGTMLRRVIALQDGFLATGVNGLQDWLRDAERP
jgi:hypothetical protein